MKITRILLLATLAMSLFACSPEDTDQAETTRIAILHTNDMHASLDHFGKLDAYKKEMGKKYDHVVLVSAGDIFSGNPVVDFYEDKGYPMVDLMNRVGYQASTVGNHEFDYGQEVFKKRMKQANFPFICANMDTRDAVLPRTEPYVILEEGGYKLFFLGLVELGNNGVPSTHPDKVRDIVFTDPLESAGKYIDQHKSYDAFIGLTHLGYDTDKKLASRYEQFDAILGGHSHTLVDTPQVINDVLLSQAGDDMEYVGKVTLTFQEGELTDRSAEMVSLANHQQSSRALDSLVKQYRNNEALNRVIGEAASDIRGKDELGSLFTDAQRKMHDLDFSFQNNGGIRIGEIPKGPIRVKTIYALDPFGNELIEYKMTPAEIKSLIRNASHHGHVDLQVSGGQYTLHLNEADEVEHVEILDKNGNKLNPDSTYQVGLNSYIASSYDFDHSDEGESLYVTTAQNLIDYIEQQGTVDYAGVKRVFVEQLK